MVVSDSGLIGDYTTEKPAAGGRQHPATETSLNQLVKVAKDLIEELPEVERE